MFAATAVLLFTSTSLTTQAPPPAPGIVVYVLVPFSTTKYFAVFETEVVLDVDENWNGNNGNNGNNGGGGGQDDSVVPQGAVHNSADVVEMHPGAYRHNGSPEDVHMVVRRPWIAHEVEVAGPITQTTTRTTKVFTTTVTVTTPPQGGQPIIEKPERIYIGHHRRPI